jgi:ribosome-associated protein
MATEDLIVDDRVTIPGAELDLSFSRSGGPGGQHVNTTDSRVRLQWAMSASSVISSAAKGRFAAAHASWMTSGGDVALFCDMHRSQHRNVDEARQRLAQAVHAALRPPKPRTKTKPTKASKARRVAAKKQRGDTKSKRGRVQEDKG